MTSRNKVWVALMVLIQLLSQGDVSAATHYVDVNKTSMTPSTLNIIPGDTVVFTIKSGNHYLFENGAAMFGGEYLLPNTDRSKVFSQDGTINITSSYSIHAYCVITSAYPPNIAPIVNLNLTSTLAVTNSTTNLTLRANAQDDDGSIRRVLFFYGEGTNISGLTNLIGTFTNSVNTNNTVFNIVWSNAVPGRYLLQARAVDNQEVIANSLRVNLSLYTPFTNSLPAITNVSGVSNLVFRFNTDTGLVYVVEASTNLVNWSPIVTNTATNSLIEILDTNVTSLTNRMYRVRLVP